MRYAEESDGFLPGPVNPAIRQPAANPDATYLSNPTLPFARFIPAGNSNSTVWASPSNRSAMETLNNQGNAPGMSFVLNNRGAAGQVTNLSQMFGAPTPPAPPALPSRRLSQLVAAGTTVASGQDVTSHSDIWMVSDIDGVNYSDAVADAVPCPTPAVATTPASTTTRIAASQAGSQPVKPRPARGWIFRVWRAVRGGRKRLSAADHPGAAAECH